ncbi:high affinity immunoglobulin epsilon receptor subunit gamma [Cuculus canorus]|uniref:high affinity immunoglobulin epsilon receptor subunit gamma n=1 Tax=Cuculus canorus TaxID=55661 RepID=UPI0023AA47EF|nr:high affinity immunoglobulin epsilon receptor subunit gamma [Cuculus canorus]
MWPRLFSFPREARGEGKLLTAVTAAPAQGNSGFGPAGSPGATRAGDARVWLPRTLSNASEQEGDGCAGRRGGSIAEAGRKALVLRSPTPAPSPRGARHHFGEMGARLPLSQAVAVLVLLRVPAAEALVEPELCYILDAILFLYGIVLTGLYCRLKFLARHRTAPPAAGKEQKEEGVYAGLSGESHELYETLQREPA